MLKVIGIACGVIGIGYLCYKLYKEFTFLHRVAVDTMDVNNKMEVLYSRCINALLEKGVTDKQRLETICNTLIFGFRPGLAC